MFQSSFGLFTCTCLEPYRVLGLVSFCSAKQVTLKFEYSNDHDMVKEWILIICWSKYLSVCSLKTMWWIDCCGSSHELVQSSFHVHFNEQVFSPHNHIYVACQAHEWCSEVAEWQSSWSSFENCSFSSQALRQNSCITLAWFMFSNGKTWFLC